MGAQAILALIMVLAIVVWAVQLFLIYRQAEQEGQDPIFQVSGAAIFFVAALPLRMFAPDIVNRLGGFWERLLGPDTFGQFGSDTSDQLPRLIVAGKTIPLTQDRVQIGRYENNDLVLDHPTISAYHAEIMLRPDGKYELMDRDSRNGTRINGELVRSAILKHGDQITLGALTVHYLVSTDAERSLL
jgi:hypothetical protein